MVLRKWTWAFVMALMVVFSSCEKEDSISTPSILNSGAEGSDIELGFESTVRLAPIFKAEGTPVYSWTVNGEPVSDEYSYLFDGHGKACGSYDVVFTLENESGKNTTNYTVNLHGRYNKGLFLVNEGWFGHETGNVNFWDRKSDEILEKVYQRENPGKELGVTTQYACLSNGKLFLVSKMVPNLVVVDAETMKEEGRLSLADGASQARAFACVDSENGFMSSSDGIYPVNLKTMTLGDKISGISGEVGNLLVADGVLYALKSKSLLVISTSDLSVTKTITFDSSAGGMVMDNGGNLWVGAGSKLIKVKCSDASFESIDLPEGVSVNSSFGWAWNAGSMTYSAKSNCLYFANAGGWAPSSISKYDISSKEGKKLVSIDSDYQIYGAGVYLDPISGKLIVTAVKNGWGQNYKYNRLYVYSEDGTKENVLNYENFYFPALCVGNN